MDAASAATPTARRRLLLQQPPPSDCVNAVSWPEVLRSVLHLLPTLECDLPTAALAALSEMGEYTALCGKHRLALLRALCDAFLGCWSTQQLLKEDAKRHEETGLAWERRTAERAAHWRAEDVRASMDARTEARLLFDPHHEISNGTEAASALPSTPALRAPPTGAMAGASHAARHWLRPSGNDEATSVGS